MEFVSLLRRREWVSADGQRGQNLQALGHSLLTGAEKEAAAAERRAGRRGEGGDTVHNRRAREGYQRCRCEANPHT